MWQILFLAALALFGCRVQAAASDADAWRTIDAGLATLERHYGIDSRTTQCRDDDDLCEWRAANARLPAIRARLDQMGLDSRPPQALADCGVHYSAACTPTNLQWYVTGLVNKLGLPVDESQSLVVQPHDPHGRAIPIVIVVAAIIVFAALFFRLRPRSAVPGEFAPGVRRTDPAGRDRSIVVPLANELMAPDGVAAADTRKSTAPLPSAPVTTNAPERAVAELAQSAAESPAREPEMAEEIEAPMPWGAGSPGLPTAVAPAPANPPTSPVAESRVSPEPPATDGPARPVPAALAWVDCLPIDKAERDRVTAALARPGADLAPGPPLARAILEALFARGAQTWDAEGRTALRQWLTEVTDGQAKLIWPTTGEPIRVPRHARLLGGTERVARVLQPGFEWDDVMVAARIIGAKD